MMELPNGHTFGDFLSVASMPDQPNTWSLPIGIEFATLGKVLVAALGGASSWQPCKQPWTFSLFHKCKQEPVEMQAPSPSGSLEPFALPAAHPFKKRMRETCIVKTYVENIAAPEFIWTVSWESVMEGPWPLLIFEKGEEAEIHLVGCNIHVEVNSDGSTLALSHSCLTESVDVQVRCFCASSGDPRFADQKFVTLHSAYVNVPTGLVVAEGVQEAEPVPPSTQWDRPQEVTDAVDIIEPGPYRQESKQRFGVTPPDVNRTTPERFKIEQTSKELERAIYARFKKRQ